MLARAPVCACQSEGGRERERLNQLMCVCGVCVCGGGDVRGMWGGAQALRSSLAVFRLVVLLEI